jgi:tRNA threonylcarbamoyladenosine biosynthesis protein TsaB
MLVMGLDTALQRCSVAIVRDGETLAHEAIGMEKGHAERLAPMAAAALQNAKIAVADLDRIGVVTGPGGFTGVRVALSFARGLAVGTGVPVAGISSLAALAAAVDDANENDLIAAVIDARRGQVYAGLYDGKIGERLAPFVATPDEALQKILGKADGRNVVLTGTGAELIAGPENWKRSAAPDQIDATIVARLAALSPQPGSPPAPVYLRPPDAKPPRPGLFEGLNKS